MPEEPRGSTDVDQRGGEGGEDDDDEGEERKGDKEMLGEVGILPGEGFERRMGNHLRR